MDLNHDGIWKEEWYIRNLRLNLSPGSTLHVNLSVPIPFPPAWMRISLTNEAINESTFSEVGGWDGSGSFDFGEIEDYLIGVSAPIKTTAGGNLSVRLAKVPPLLTKESIEGASKALNISIYCLSFISEALNKVKELRIALENVNDILSLEVSSISSEVGTLRAIAVETKEKTRLIRCETIRKCATRQVDLVFAP